jgi:signal transduction histidine kinase
VLRDATEQVRRENEEKFFAEVGSVLASTLGYEETLMSIAQLAVRDIADVCTVDIIGEDGELRRLKVATRDPSRAWAGELLTQIPFDRKRPSVVWTVLKTRKPVVLPQVKPEMLAAVARDEEHLRALRALDVKTSMAVPLLMPGKVLGVLYFSSSSSSREYGPADVRVAEELARRAALALENARLYRAAQRATQLRDDVLRIVAHDLRNPLNSVVIQANLLRGHGDKPEQRAQKAAEVIGRAATRMNRLIQDLLDVTRIEAGKFSIQAKQVPATLLLADVFESQKPLVEAASLDLHIELPTRLPDIWADRDRLSQVFENLIGNALKFTAPGGRITVGAQPRDGEVLFWVSDTGAGVPEGEISHLFEWFWQASRADRRGAGLGLPIVKGIVEEHHGRVWVESTPGVGSTFFFTVPTASGTGSHPAEPWA